MMRRLLDLVLKRQAPPWQTSYGAASVALTIDPMLDIGTIQHASDPPKAPATIVGGPNKVTPWAGWKKMLDEHYTPPQWTFCRFGLRAAAIDTQAEVLGIVRNGFGTYWCGFVYYPEQETPVHGYLAVCVHIRSGFALGIFADMVVAVEACEIAMRLSHQVEFSPDTGFGVFGDALHAAGFCNRHMACRPVSNDKVVPGPLIPVWIKHETEAAPEGIVPS